jgi:hypothetical protein
MAGGGRTAGAGCETVAAAAAVDRVLGLHWKIRGAFYFLPFFTLDFYLLPSFTLTSLFCPTLLCHFIICPFELFSFILRI